MNLIDAIMDCEKTLLESSRIWHLRTALGIVVDAARKYERLSPAPAPAVVVDASIREQYEKDHGSAIYAKTGNGQGQRDYYFNEYVHYLERLSAPAPAPAPAPVSEPCKCDAWPCSNKLCGAD